MKSLLVAAVMTVAVSACSHSPQMGCWTELKPDFPAERLCGDVSKAAPGSVDFGPWDAHGGQKGIVLDRNGHEVPS